MKKTFAVLLLLVSFSTLTKAQVGLGLGSAGLHIKTSPEKTFGFIGRLGFSLGNNSVLLPEVNGIKRLINEDKAKLYLGAGLGAYLSIDNSYDQISSIFLRAPVGIEYFPFENKTISFTAETGLLYYGATERNNSLNFISVLEITFYLRKRSS